MARLGLVLAVTAIGGLRRRAGFAFSTSLTPLDWGQVDRVQLRQIVEDPQLTAEVRITSDGALSPEHPALALNPPFGLLVPTIEEMDRRYQEYQSAQGAEEQEESDASLSADAEAKGDGEKIAPPPADPLGTDGVAAGQSAAPSGDTAAADAANGAAPEAQSAASEATETVQNDAEAKSAEAKKPSGSPRKAKAQPASDQAD